VPAAGHVRLAALPSSNATLIPAALTDLTTRGLDVTVSLVEAGPDQSYALLQHAECDLAVTFDHPTLPAPPGLVLVPLLDDHLFVILPANHPLAGEEQVSASPPPASAATPTTRMSRASRSPASPPDESSPSYPPTGAPPRPPPPFWTHCRRPPARAPTAPKPRPNSAGPGHAREHGQRQPPPTTALVEIIIALV
jgi:hypothetical protein